MTEERKITVKINGKNQAFHEVSEEDKSLKDEHSLEEIYEQLENVIDFKKKKQEKERNREPFWDDGNHRKIPKLPFHKRKKKRLFGELSKLPLTILLASISAIIIGLGLGMMLLTIFTGGSEETGAPDVTQAAADVGAKEVTATIGDKSSVYLIQVGAFSSLEKGKEMANLIGEKGFSAVLNEQANPKLLFAGIALERGQAEKLKEMLEQEGIEAFIKTEQIEIREDEGGQNIQAIYERLLHVTEKGLINEIQSDEIASIQLKMNELALGDGEVEKGLHDAMNNLQSYLKNQEKQILWQTQGKLIDVTLALKRTQQ